MQENTLGKINQNQLTDQNDLKQNEFIEKIYIQKKEQLTNNNKTNDNNKKSNNNNGIRIDYYGQEILKNNKKHKVSFIDQIHSKKDIAQIIYINDQVSLKDDRVDTNKYFEILRKQSTNITEFSRKEKKDAETYKIKRPKSASQKLKRKKNESKEECGCRIF